MTASRGPLRWPFAFALVALVAIFVSLPLFHWSFSTTDAWWRVFTWWIIMGVLVLFTLVAGWAIVGRPLGALVDERNRMSLSRLQLIVWTIVVLSAFMTIV